MALIKAVPLSPGDNLPGNTFVCTKVAYSSKSKADRALQETVRRSRIPKLDRGKRPKQSNTTPTSFFCIRCQAWHWGHAYSKNARDRVNTIGPPPT